MEDHLKELVYIPVDLPTLEFDRAKLEQWYDANKTRGIEQYVAAIGYPWNVVWLRDEDKGIDWRSDLEEVFPGFHENLKNLPHIILRKVYILEQVIDVEPHRDVSREDDPDLGPSTYRAMLINDNPDTLYYMKVDGPSEKKFPRFPKPGMWFTHNNYNARHGAIMPKSPDRKLILCVWGNVRRTDHEDLIRRSYGLYKDYSIKKDDL